MFIVLGNVFFALHLFSLGECRRGWRQKLIASKRCLVEMRQHLLDCTLINRTLDVLVLVTLKCGLQEFIHAGLHVLIVTAGNALKRVVLRWRCASDLLRRGRVK